MAAEWPIRPEYTGAKIENLIPLIKRVGIWRFEQGVRRIIEGHKTDFFPTVNQLETYVPEAVYSEGYCQNCQGTHWIPAGKDAAGNEQFRRCQDCRHSQAWKPSFADYADRREHPEDYWGEADVKVLLREQMRRKSVGASFLSVNEAQEVILLAREQAKLKSSS